MPLKKKGRAGGREDSLMSALPGYGVDRECWKCGGTWLVRRVGRRAMVRQAQREAGVLCKKVAKGEKSCGVCVGSGRLGVRAKSEAAGRVSKGPVEGGLNFVGPAPSPSAASTPLAGEDLCCISGRWRIFQRQKGHRYSTEDVVTAWTALRAVGRPLRHVDLGCGVGSVLLFAAWRHHYEENYRGLGIEAQPDSWALAQRSIAWNGAKCEALLGDFRRLSSGDDDDDEKDQDLKERLDAFLSDDEACLLVTGTPPYYPVVHGSTTYGALPSCEQSAGARYEFRGGIEAYCQAAAVLLRKHRHPSSRFVCCEGGLLGCVDASRVDHAASDAGLTILSRRMVVGKIGKAPLFGVWVFALSSNMASSTVSEILPTLIVRDERGQRTPDYENLLRDMAMLPSS